MAKLIIKAETGEREMFMMEAAGTAPDLTAMLAAAVEEFTYRMLVDAPNSVIETAAKAGAALLAEAIKKGMHRAADEITAGKKAGGTE